MMKKIMIVSSLFFLLMVFSVSSVDYNYYDDFTTLNTSIWNMSITNQFDIYNNDELRCNYGYGLGEITFLPFQNFNDNDFIIEYNMTFQDRYASNLPYFSTDTTQYYSTPFNYIGFQQTRYGSTTTPWDRLIEYYNNTLYEEYGTNYYPYYIGVFKFERTNNPNGTFNLKTYFNGTSNNNFTSQLNWQSPERIDLVDKMSCLCANNDNQDWRIDWINITVFDITTISEPIITSPADATISSSKPDVVFSVTDLDNATVSCDLYNNGAIIDSNSSVLVNQSTSLYLDAVVGVNSYYINCTDFDGVALSDTQSYWYDPNDPLVTAVKPSLFNNTVFTDYEMNFTGLITNEELDYVLIQVYDNEDNLYYQNITTSFPDPTEFEYGWDFVTNSSQNGDWSMYVYANDTASNENQKNISFTVNNCIPNWVCSDYGSCNMSDLASCTNVTDTNSCDLSYTGDLSEFSAQSCDYCSQSLDTLSVTNCINEWQIVSFEDLNYKTCCNVTKLVSDCGFGTGTPPQNESQFFSYNTSCSLFYEEDDIASASVDTIVKFILAFAVFVSFAVIGFVGAWAYNKVLKK